MPYTIITEGVGDILLLQAILGIEPDDADIRFVRGGGWSAADSLARSYLVHGDTNIALVVDADANDSGLVSERRRFLERSLGEIGNKKNWRVFVFAPEMEVLLFQERRIIEELVGHPVSEQDMLRGRYAPKQVATSLAQNKGLLALLKNRLPSIDLSPIRSNPQIAELMDYLGLQKDSYIGKRERTLVRH